MKRNKNEENETAKQKMKTKTTNENDMKMKTKKTKRQKKMKYHELRYYNTLNCINLTDKLISNFIHKKKINLKRQKSVGRYYTAMPSSLKDYCIKNFERHTNYL